MFGLIQEIFLSDFLIFVVLCAMMLTVTSWAFRIGEYPGYMLGWLVGIFIVVIYSAVIGDNNVTVEEVTSDAQIQLSMFSVAVASMFGLMAGFGLLFFTRMTSGRSASPGTRSQGRGITVAVLMALLVMSLFILVTSDVYTRKIIGIFALAFAIGALSNVVLGGSPNITPRNYPPPEDPYADGYNYTAQSGNIPRAPGDAIQSRFDRLRRRIERRE
jgi:hypothetical protein